MLKDLNISTRATDIDGCSAAISLGGFTLYGLNESQLNEGVSAIALAIEDCSSRYLSLFRTSLRSEVRKQLDCEIDDSVFGAVLGSRLRYGMLDSVPCAAEKGGIFRAYLHRDQIETFQRYLKETAGELRRRRVVHIRDIEAAVLGTKRWGSRSSTLHILGRLVQIGQASYLDKDSFRWPSEIEHAISHSQRQVRVIKRGRLANC
jgi:hypothetical protein